MAAKDRFYFGDVRGRMCWGNSYQALGFPGAGRGSGYDVGEQYNDSCFDAMGFANSAF